MVLKCLIIENDPRWIEQFFEALSLLGPVEIVTSSTHEAALAQIHQNTRYDLILLDLNLDNYDSPAAIARGMKLLHQMRESVFLKETAILVVTAFATIEITREALRHYDADIVDKHHYMKRNFVQAVRLAVATRRIRASDLRRRARHTLTITISSDAVVRSKFEGPASQDDHQLPMPRKFKGSNLISRCDKLDLLIRKGNSVEWRAEATALGDAVYREILEEPYILGQLRLGRQLAADGSTLWLSFRTTTDRLGLPFELLRLPGDSPTVLRYVLIRRLAQPVARRLPFHRIVDEFLDTRQVLRVLVVGADHHGELANVTNEVDMVGQLAEQALNYLGIAAQVTRLAGEEATYNNLAAALRDGGYHILHYAGHGVTDSSWPESSGLVLHDALRSRTLTATDLDLLLDRSQIRLAFLNCCFSAHSAASAESSDFHGTVEAFARAGVSSVLACRWSLDDSTAYTFAELFYEQLWRTLSPAEALLHARRELSMGIHGRNSESWAAPVLLMQNP